MKRVLSILGIIILIVLAYGVYQIATFELFDDEPVLLEVIDVPDKNYFLRVYQWPSNAVTQPSIYVNKIEGSSNDFLIAYERYDSLISHYSKMDSLFFVLGYKASSIIDTVSLKIP